MPRDLKKLPDPNSADYMRLGFLSTLYGLSWRYAHYDPFRLSPLKKKRHEKQVQFHFGFEEDTTFRGYVGGRASGKTTAGAAEAVRQAIEQPGSEGIILAPTYKVLKQATQKTFFKMLHPWLIHSYNDSDKRLEIINGSLVWFRSTEEEDVSRGIDATWFWADEAALMGHMAWDILLGCLRQVHIWDGLPYNHMGWATSTPRGFTFLWELFEKTGHPLENNYIISSARDNPWLTDKFIQRLVNKYTGAFAQQEIEGLWTAFEGLVYPEFNPEVHVVNIYEPPHIERKYSKMLYLHDFGLHNPMVVLACGVDGDERMWILEEVYAEDMLVEEMIQERIRMEEKWGKGQGIADPSNPEAIYRLNRAGCTTRKPRNIAGKMRGSLEKEGDVNYGVSLLRGRLKVQRDGRPRLFVDRRAVNTISEFRQYVYEESKEGRPIKERPLKVNDHSMDAARYGAMDLDRGAPMELVVLDELEAATG